MRQAPDQFVEQHAEAEEIAARIERFAARLLKRHVCGRADDSRGDRRSRASSASPSTYIAM